MSNSTTASHSRKGDRPQKPYKDFPLAPHPVGQWCKKIRGKIHYFGAWGKRAKGRWEILPDKGNWKAALELYKAQADDLHAGRTPRAQTGSLTIMDLCNQFLTAKKRQLEAGELAAHSFGEYRRATDLLIAELGRNRLVEDLVSGDFEALRAEMSKRWGPVRLGNAVQQVRTVFKYAYDNGLIEKPVRFGSSFKKPSALVLRRHKANSGEKLFEADQLRRLLDALQGKEVETGRTDEETGEPEKVTLGSDPALRAMVLLGINCGFGNADCATLPLALVDLENGWVDFPRPKTGVPRRCPLWPETVEALEDVMAARPEPKAGAEGLVFVTTRGRPWLSRDSANPVSVAASRAMKAVGVHREGLGFYTLRHTFRTIADEARDPVAIDLVMGHADHTMGATYRERIADARLQAVVEHVRTWLFGEDAPKDESDETDARADLSEGPQHDNGSKDDDRPRLRLFAG